MTNKYQIRADSKGHYLIATVSEEAVFWIMEKGKAEPIGGGKFRLVEGVTFTYQGMKIFFWHGYTIQRAT